MSFLREQVRVYRLGSPGCYWWFFVAFLVVYWYFPQRTPSGRPCFAPSGSEWKSACPGKRLLCSSRPWNRWSNRAPRLNSNWFPWPFLEGSWLFFWLKANRRTVRHRGYSHLLVILSEIQFCWLGGRWSPVTFQSPDKPQKFTFWTSQ